MTQTSSLSLLRCPRTAIGAAFLGRCALHGIRNAEKIFGRIPRNFTSRELCKVKSGDLTLWLSESFNWVIEKGRIPSDRQETTNMEAER